MPRPQPPAPAADPAQALLDLDERLSELADQIAAIHQRHGPKAARPYRHRWLRLYHQLFHLRRQRPA